MSERTSFLLGDEALSRLTRLSQLMGVSKSKALETLLLGLTFKQSPAPAPAARPEDPSS